MPGLLQVGSDYKLVRATGNEDRGSMHPELVGVLSMDIGKMAYLLLVGDVPDGDGPIVITVDDGCGHIREADDIIDELLLRAAAFKHEIICYFV